MLFLILILNLVFSPVVLAADGGVPKCGAQDGVPYEVRYFRPTTLGSSDWKTLHPLDRDPEFVARALADEIADQLHFRQTILDAQENLDLHQRMQLMFSNLWRAQKELAKEKMLYRYFAAKSVRNRSWLVSLATAGLVGGTILGLGYAGGQLAASVELAAGHGIVAADEAAKGYYVAGVLFGGVAGLLSGLLKFLHEVPTHEINEPGNGERRFIERKLKEVFLARLKDRGVSDRMAQSIADGAHKNFLGLTPELNYVELFDKNGMYDQVKQVVASAIAGTDLSSSARAILNQLFFDLGQVKPGILKARAAKKANAAISELIEKLESAKHTYKEVSPVLDKIKKLLLYKQEGKITARDLRFGPLLVANETTRLFLQKIDPKLKTDFFGQLKDGGDGLENLMLSLSFENGLVPGTIKLSVHAEHVVSKEIFDASSEVSLMGYSTDSEEGFLKLKSLWQSSLLSTISYVLGKAGGASLLSSASSRDASSVVADVEKKPATIKPRSVRLKPKLDYANTEKGLPLDTTLQIYPPALARGGEGEVFLARRGFEKVAVKRLGERATAQDYRRFKEKVEFAGKVFEKAQSDHVLPVKEYHPEASPPFAVLPLVEGPNLDQVLNSHVLKPGDIVSVVEQTIEGLKDVHRVGIFSDLKPANILLEGDHVVLTDMGTGVSQGVAVSFGKTTTTTEAARSMYFTPPNKEEVPDRQWDVFSLGAVFYTMMAGGMNPSPDINLEDARKEPEYAKLNTSLQSWPVAAIEAAQSILNRSLTRFKSRRFKSVEEFEAEFVKLKEILKDSESDLEQISNQVWSEIIAKRKEAERTVAEAAKPESVKPEQAKEKAKMGTEVIFPEPPPVSKGIEIRKENQGLSSEERGDVSMSKRTDTVEKSPPSPVTPPLIPVAVPARAPIDSKRTPAPKQGEDAPLLRDKHSKQLESE